MSSFSVNTNTGVAHEQGYRDFELIKFEPPRDDHNGKPMPGLLVTYSKGGTGWTGRGAQKYYRDHYSVHVVTSAHESESEPGTWGVTTCRNMTIECSARFALEKNKRARA